MDEEKLTRIQCSIIGLGPHKDFATRTRYDYIRLRISDTRDTTLRDVIASTEVNKYLEPGKTAALYFVKSPGDEKFLFGIDTGAQRADVIDQIGRDQARARKQAIKWILISIPLCLVLVGILLMGMAIRGLVLLAGVPKPAEMRAFMAANPFKPQDAVAHPEAAAAPPA